MSISHQSDKENCILTNGNLVFGPLHKPVLEYASIGDLVSKKHSEENIPGNSTNRDTLKGTPVSALVDKALRQRINSNNLDKIQETSCNEEHKSVVHIVCNF
jgi:hypothetical protein